MLAMLTSIARGERLPEGFDQELAARLRRYPEVHEALERMWPVLSGTELINDLLGFRPSEVVDLCRIESN